VGLEVAVDDPAAVREARGAQDLDGQVDRAIGSSGASSRMTVFSERPRGTPSRCSRCRRTRRGRRPNDVLVLQAGGARRLAAEALDELAILGEAPVEDLQRDLAPQLQVLGAVDLGHAAAAHATEHAVAPSTTSRLSRRSVTSAAPA
jgi:hypothetical protein